MDGRIYYKGVKIKAFDSSYTDTDSKIYKAIKKAVKAIVVAEDKNTAQNALNDLKRHLYFEGKTFPIFKNVKDDTLTFNEDETLLSLMERTYKITTRKDGLTYAVLSINEYTSDFYSSYFSLYIDGKYSSVGANSIILTGGLSVEWKWIKL